ncbi:MAG: hypothetical protein IJC71_06000 [Clostridia bacterium]|nr:hypothetical protein [Clostridia bacterium]
MKKLLSGTLANLLLLQALASCAADETENPVNNAGSVQTEANETSSDTETESDVPVFPEMTFNGEDICFLTEYRNGDIYASIEIYAEGIDGTLINDAVYERNQLIEGQFDILITQERLNNADKVAATSILAQDNAYDVVMPYLNASTRNALEGYYLDLNTVDNLHLENKWWDQNANETLRIKNKLYFSTGDISILDNECMLVLFFNKPMIRDFQLDSPYDLVKEGKWTIDVLQDMSETINHDLNGDGEMTLEDDRFGLYVFPNTPMALFFASGEKITALDAEGNQQLVMYNERSADVINRIMELTLSDNVISGDYVLSEEALMQGRLLFGAWALTEIASLRDSEQDFGILPFPKYDEAQERYHCIISTILTPMVSIPVTNAEPDKAGLILEAMAYYSVDTLTHAYYDKALNGRYIRDTESSEMFDIMFASAVYDFGYIFNVGGLGNLLETMFNKKSTAFTSSYKRMSKKALNEIETIFGEAAVN